jgi:ribosomal protein S18 acetylase RimI-like enzyme
MEMGDLGTVLDAGHLFDDRPRAAWTRRFLERDGHHLLIAFLDDRAVGFVSGIEISHPDKATEMLLYELGVDEPFRRRGVARDLVQSLADVARERRCRGMWVPVEDGNEPALATYRSAGASSTESATVAWWDLDSGQALQT